ncbi:MAG: type II toxin-antitoxin system VapB family antitoxin [Treponematales bacterium]|jgi:hypothetical protein
MTQIAIDDKLIKQARSLIDEKVSDEAIVTAALEGWILRRENVREILDAYGRLHWDSEFAGALAGDGQTL